MRMKAKQLGFIRGARVRPGQEFHLPAGKKPPKWAVPVGAAEETKSAPPEEPATFSELNRQTVAAEKQMLDKKMAPKRPKQPEPTDLTD